jgi:DNA-binding CsgD family transcriptional regulator
VRENPVARIDAVAAVRPVSSLLDQVSEELALEFELALLVSVTHPAQRSRGVARIERLVERVDSDCSAGWAGRALLDMQHFAQDSSVSAVELRRTLEGILNPATLAASDLSESAVQARACWLLLGADAFEPAERVLEAARGLARERGDLAGEDEVLRLLIASKLWRGSLDEAEGICAERRLLQVGLKGRGRGALEAAALRFEQRRHTDGLAELGSLDRMASAGLEWHLLRGGLLAGAGRLDESLSAFDAARRAAEEEGISNPVLARWRGGAALVLERVGRHDEALGLAAEQLEAARSFGAARSLGATLRVSAAVAARADRRPLLEEAAIVLDGSDAKLEEAQALVELGAEMVRQGDKVGARGILSKGAELALNCGASAVVDEAATCLRQAGARPRRLGRRGLAALTPSELRVVKLAAAGATNRETAKTLFVNIKTIEGHLSRAYKKLGVESRSELIELLSRDVDAEVDVMLGEPGSR